MPAAYTFLAIFLIGLFYAFTTWAMVVGTHVIAEQVEDVSYLLATLGRPVIIDANDGRADEAKRPVGGSVRSSARHPREQAQKLFPSREFH